MSYWLLSFLKAQIKDNDLLLSLTEVSIGTASRMESHGIAGEIQVTEMTHDIIKDKFQFEERGVIDVKGKGMMRTWILKGSFEN